MEQHNYLNWIWSNWAARPLFAGSRGIQLCWFEWAKIMEKVKQAATHKRQWQLCGSSRKMFAQQIPCCEHLHLRRQKNNKTPQRVCSCGKQIFATSHTTRRRTRTKSQMKIRNSIVSGARERWIIGWRETDAAHGGARKCWQNYVIAIIIHSDCCAEKEWEKVFLHTAHCYF